MCIRDSNTVRRADENGTGESKQDAGQVNITGRLQSMEICKFRDSKGDEKIDEEGIGRCLGFMQKKTLY